MAYTPCCRLGAIQTISQRLTVFFFDFSYSVYCCRPEAFWLPGSDSSAGLRLSAGFLGSKCRKLIVSINADFLKKNLRFALRSLPLIWPRLAYNNLIYAWEYKYPNIRIADIVLLSDLEIKVL